MSSMWAFITGLFTPASLFIILNLTIATIFIITRFGSHRKPQQQLGRASSLLERVKSFNLSLYKFEQPSADSVTEFLQTRGTAEHVDHYANSDHQPPPLARAPSLLEHLKSINLSSLYRSDSSTRETEIPQPSELEQETPDPNAATDSGESHDHLVKRSYSDRGVGIPARPVEKIKKSASEKSAFGQSGEKESGRKSKTTSSTCDEEVDAKADDFINRFKQQLRLQRLDSLLRRGN